MVVAGYEGILRKGRDIKELFEFLEEHRPK